MTKETKTESKSDTKNEAPPAAAKLQGWFAGRLPDGWFTGPPDVTHDRDEIVVVGTLARPRHR